MITLINKYYNTMNNTTISTISFTIVTIYNTNSNNNRPLYVLQLHLAQPNSLLEPVVELVFQWKTLWRLLKQLEISRLWLLQSKLANLKVNIIHLLQHQHHQLINYLIGALSGSEKLTVFAPTDDAFAKLPAGTVDALLKDIPKLTNILLYHVVKDLANPTRNGSKYFKQHSFVFKRYLTLIHFQRHLTHFSLDRTISRKKYLSNWLLEIRKSP